MPEAHTGYVAPVAREYFEHAHDGLLIDFPPSLTRFEAAYIFWKCPTNWTGFARVRLWLLPFLDDAALAVSVKIDAATCGEALATHTETHALTPAVSANILKCVELLTDFATVLTLITPCDLVEFTVTNNDSVTDFILYGVEIVEA